MPKELFAAERFSTEVTFRGDAGFGHSHVLPQLPWHCKLFLAFATNFLTVVLLGLVFPQLAYLVELLLAFLTGDRGAINVGCFVHRRFDPD